MFSKKIFQFGKPVPQSKPLGWPLLNLEEKSSQNKREFYQFNPLLISNPVSDGLKLRPKSAITLHSQPGFEVTKYNNHLKAKINLEELERKNLPKEMSKSRTSELKAEIERLGILLKEEQNFHAETKAKSKNDISDLESKLLCEHEKTLQELMDKFQVELLAQQRVFEESQRAKDYDYQRQRKQVEDELADNQIGFEHFQAQSRRQFEEEFARKVKLIADEESEKRILMEEKFQSRLRTKLREQREEIENENIEMLANIENKQKIEISKMAVQISANKNAKDLLNDSESKIGTISAKLEKTSQKLSETEKSLAEFKAQFKREVQKNSDVARGHKRDLESVQTYNNQEKSRLLTEISLLRNRLIKNAETLGEVQFQQNTNQRKVVSDMTEGQQKWKNRHEGRLEDILKINQSLT